MLQFKIIDEICIMGESSAKELKNILIKIQKKIL